VQETKIKNSTMPKIIIGQAPTSKNLAPIKIIKNPVISKKNERDSLSIIYAGKKKFFANFLSEDRRIKLKKIIEKYYSMSK
jgi:hypothetical protein